MTSEYAEIKRLEREIEKARIAAEQWEAKSKQLEAEVERHGHSGKQEKGAYKDAEIKRIVAELEQVKAERDGLSAENKRLTAENQSLRRVVAEAKDPSPVQRASFKRVQALAANACLSLQRLRSGWLLKLGHLERRFRSLGQIWQILIQEDWSLSDVFPREPVKHQQPRLPFRHPVLAAKCP